MINRASILQWRTQVPWNSSEQVEQDLIICRALVAIFSDEFLASQLAFRGGTALHKLYLSPQSRYSEDIDLVQIEAEPIKPILSRLGEVLDFSVSQPPTYKQFILNMESKMTDPDFLEDMGSLIRSDETYDIQKAYQIVKQRIIEKLLQYF